MVGVKLKDHYAIEAKERQRTENNKETASGKLPEQQKGDARDKAAQSVGVGAMWWLGDWWAFGNHSYGDRKALIDSDDWDGPTFATVTNASSICIRFECSRRRELVSFNHHAECASLPPEEADKILDECEQHLEKTGKLPINNTSPCE